MEQSCDCARSNVNSIMNEFGCNMFTQQCNVTLEGQHISNIGWVALNVYNVPSEDKSAPQYVIPRAKLPFSSITVPFLILGRTEFD